ncbi:MAG: quinone oxidoreductase [Alphaproteobacteria bacterium]
MADVIRFASPGGPDVLALEHTETGDPGDGEVRIKQTAVGLNYIDVYHRTGQYPLPLPSGVGIEAAGIVEAVGDGVTDLTEGDRVAYGAGPIGAYASERLMPAGRLVKLPDAISDETGAAMMLKGMTAEYLIRRTFEVKAGMPVLFHAAAGGVGLIVGQWLKHIGAITIGTVGTKEKAELARAHGYDHTILYREEDIAARVRDITGGDGVPVVYDGVGQDTFSASIDSLAPRGLMVSFGAASGPVPAVEPKLLSQKGSLYFTRPTVMTYVERREDLVDSTNALFAAVQAGVKIEINQRYALKDAARAHRDLEARKTTGSSILIP